MDWRYRTMIGRIHFMIKHFMNNLYTEWMREHIQIFHDYQFT